MTVLAYSNLQSLTSSKLHTLRRDLKIKIYHERREPGKHPICPICKKEITIEEGADMHEVFLTRGDAMGIKDEDERFQIYNACNCVLVHHGVCHGRATSEEGKKLCAMQIIKCEGYDKIRDFFERMGKVFTSGKPVIEWLYVRTLPFLLIKDQPKSPRWEF